MKKVIILSMLMLIISNGIFAQSSNKFTNEEIARIKFSVHLITYDTVSCFETAKGEAYYTMVINMFKNNLVVPDFFPSDITSADKNKIDVLIQQLKKVKQNPPTWESLYERQTKYLMWLDKVMRKQSKYKY